MLLIPLSYITNSSSRTSRRIRRGKRDKGSRVGVRIVSCFLKWRLFFLPKLKYDGADALFGRYENFVISSAHSFFSSATQTASKVSEVS
ncbi:hypothetical protein AB6A40_008571 [Gnathostoma spinigerum]|uniref:Ribosomal protein L32 n=1 Tax=Gnathostoma spinigerum TaxID=75299 RepID=A0ABD6EZ18_9BILA